MRAGMRTATHPREDSRDLIYYRRRGLLWRRKKEMGQQDSKWLLERLKAVVVVPSDDEVCREYGRLKARLQKTGIVVADNDLWIAACALRHSVPLISNNRKHFEKISVLQLISLALEKAPAVPTKKNLFDRDREE
jgi:predicted nucleic acid-binding protein